MRGQAQLPPHRVLELCLRPHLDGAVRQLQRCRGFGPHRLGLLYRPVGTVIVQRGQNRLDHRRGEVRLDIFLTLLHLALARLFGKGGQRFLDPVRPVFQRLDQCRAFVAGRVGGRDARGHGVRRFQARARQAHPHARLARQPRQEIGAADIGIKTDARLRHGQHRAVPGHPVIAMHGNADAAAHNNAVDHRDIGLGVTLDQLVETIFVAPEFIGALVPGLAAFIKQADIAARAEAAIPGAVHHDHLHVRVVAPLQ